MNQVHIEKSERNGQAIYRIAEVFNGVTSYGAWIETSPDYIYSRGQQYAERVGSVFVGIATESRAA